MLTNDELRAELKAQLGAKKLGELYAVVQAADQERRAELETAKAAPMPAPLTTEQWAALKAFLTDGGDPGQPQEIYLGCRAALRNDNQPAFFRRLVALYKSLRKATPHLEDGK